MTINHLAKVALLLILAIALWWVWGPAWKSYPSVTSPEAQKLIQLIYNAASARDPQRLAAAQARLDALDQAGKLSAGEKKSFVRILDLGRSQQWESAQRASLKFAADQIRSGAD